MRRTLAALGIVSIPSAVQGTAASRDAVSRVARSDEARSSPVTTTRAASAAPAARTVTPAHIAELEADAGLVRSTVCATAARSPTPPKPSDAISTTDEGAADSDRLSEAGVSRDWATARFSSPSREPPLSQPRAASAASWEQIASPSRSCGSMTRQAAICPELGNTKCSATRIPAKRAMLAARASESPGMPPGPTRATTASTGRRQGSAFTTLRRVRLSAFVASMSRAGPPAAIPMVPAPGGVSPRLR